MVLFTFLNHELIMISNMLIFRYTCDKHAPSFSKAARAGYEIPALLYSLFKPTRTLVAKTIGRKKHDHWSLDNGVRTAHPERGCKSHDPSVTLTRIN